MTAIVLSDIHLRDASSLKTKIVIRFFQEVASRFENIYILGDLFDVWPGTSDYLVRSFEPVVKALKDLVQDGRQVHYIEGNHDFRLGNYFTETLGIKVYPDSLDQTWNGHRVYMTHGDQGNPRDLGSRLLRNVLRQDFLHAALRAVPQEWIFKVGLQSSKLSRKFQTTRKQRPSDSAIREIYRKRAHAIFRKGYDVVIMGHTHLPDDVSTVVGGRNCRYFNTGDWVKNFTYLEFDGARFYTRTHPIKNH